MRIQIPLLAMGLALALASCNGEPPPPAVKTVVALIFCDVTNSLTEGESERVSSIAVSIVDSLPDGAVFKLYPIQIQTEVPAQIKIDLNGNNSEDPEDYSVPRPKDNVEAQKQEGAREQQRKERREQIRKGVDALYRQQNRGVDNRTCIMNALGFASNYISTHYGDAKKYDVRMFLISDMIEECNDTPLPDGRVEMDKRDISAEIQRAAAFQAAHSQTRNPAPESSQLTDRSSPDPAFQCDLAAVTIYCVFPAAEDTSKVPSARRPSRGDVKAFWNEIFKGCGFGGSPRRGDEEAHGGRIIWVDSGDLTEPLKNLRAGRG